MDKIALVNNDDMTIFLTNFNWPYHRMFIQCNQATGKQKQKGKYVEYVLIKKQCNHKKTKFTYMT